MDYVLDFAVTSDMTARTDNTFDGLHYGEKVSELVVKALSNPDDSANRRIDNISEQAYRDKYHFGLMSFLEKQRGENIDFSL